MRCQATTASDPHVRIAFVLLFLAAVSDVARAQSPSEAAQIIEAFGSGGTLSQSGDARVPRVGRVQEAGR